jgi:hypothetical protein
MEEFALNWPGWTGQYVQVATVLFCGIDIKNLFINFFKN